MKEYTVLVGTPISQKKSDTTPQFLEQCTRLTYSNRHHYFVDNSADPNWHIGNIVAKGFDCGYQSPKGLTQPEFITLSQLKIREAVLKYNFDFLFFLECDIFVPDNIIEQLLSYNTDIAVCNYFIGHGESTRMLRIEIEEKPFGITTDRFINKYESFMEYNTDHTQAKSFGFGATLIKKSVLERHPFHLKKENKEAHSDSSFYHDISQEGIEVKVHPIIVCHKNSSQNSN